MIFLDEQKKLTKLADMFHVTPSALRYWDKQGLIRFERSLENNYRYPTIQSMLDICDILLNRSLSISIKEMKKIPEMNIEELEEILIQNEAKLLQQAEEIQKTIKRIHIKQKVLEKFNLLQKQTAFMIENKKFSAIKEFSFESESDLQRFVQDPTQCAILLIPGMENQYGLFSQQNEFPLLRKADTEERNYLKGILRLSSDDEKDNNHLEFFQEAKRLGGSPGSIFGQYLISTYDGRRYDYYEGWMEIFF